MSASPGDRAVKLAGRMLQLGIARDMVHELLSYPLDQVEAQLDWLPYRANVKRQGAFLINAIRRNYSPPKQFYYAHIKAIRGVRAQTLDEDSKPRD